jgi:phage baseplate assembly protein W
MRPQFGAGVGDFVFDTNTPVTRTRLADAIRQALVRWEPRIDLAGVRVDEVPDQRTQVMATIEYRLRDTNELFNLVYPLYLAEGAR